MSDDIGQAWAKSELGRIVPPIPAEVKGFVNLQLTGN